MTEDFKKWLCELTNKYYRKPWKFKISGDNNFSKPRKNCGVKIDIETLINAMWAINRDENLFYGIHMDEDEFILILKDGQISFPFRGKCSEEQALIAVLEYINKQEKNKE